MHSSLGHRVRLCLKKKKKQANSWGNGPKWGKKGVLPDKTYNLLHISHSGGVQAAAVHAFVRRLRLSQQQPAGVLAWQLLFLQKRKVGTHLWSMDLEEEDDRRWVKP